MFLFMKLPPVESVLLINAATVLSVADRQYVDPFEDIQKENVLKRLFICVVGG